MSTFSSDGEFVYPDPSFYGLYERPDLSQADHSAPAEAPAAVATAPAPSAPPLDIDPALLALPGPAPIAAPILAPSAGAPRLSVIGTMFPGFPAGLVPPIQINGEDATRYSGLVADVYNTTYTGLRSGTPYGNSDPLDERRSRKVRELQDMWATAGGLPTPREQ